MFSQSDLRRFFDAGTFERGRRYWQEGRVRGLEVKHERADRWTLASSVRGSGRVPYDQDIMVTVADGKVVELDGNCDCPIGYNCKHVAAALLDWAERLSRQLAGRPSPAPPVRSPSVPARLASVRKEPSSPEPALSVPVRDLLSRLNAAALREAADQHPDTVRKRLLYVLDLDDTPAGQRALLLRVVSVTLRKDGAFGNDEKSYGPHQFGGLNASKFVVPADHALLDALSRNAQSSSLGFLLPADAAPWLIGRMLPTGRRYWRDFREGRPLRPGPGLAGTPRWETDRTGHQRFAITTGTAARRPSCCRPCRCSMSIRRRASAARSRRSRCPRTSPWCC
ncbi:SWIM zinc finger family protein [Azospirillum picis]|uniref:SWIM-type domain-containing protein n=1 Tax=Azospirillum picis TaxID=488438 RepID=A0ABU0MNF9_9PROT|nr:SWIM zinc finger family protein [Azospirillum picis]MBP2301830.1 hypothetical protein [Azospirillum picis]MDQ0534995.1 hypothetical protein [Azospirillum picis]